MNTARLLCLALAFTATPLLAANEAQPLQVSDSADGVRPDVAQVISITPVPDNCQVNPATMVYLDHDGQRRELNYRVMGTCWTDQ